MRGFTRGLAVLLAAILLLVPVLAEAGPGAKSGGGIGSRGERTHNAVPSTNTAPGGSQSIQRTQTPPPGYQGGPSHAPSPGMAPAGGGFFQRNPFLGGLLAGGVLGAVLGGGGGGLFGGGSFLGILGVLLQIFLVIVLVRFVIRLFRGSSASPAMAGGRPINRPTIDVPPTGGYGAGPAGVPPQRSDMVGIGPADYQAFEQLLGAVQAAWTSRDRDAITRLVTPEIFQFLTDEVIDDDRQGRHNKVEDVKLLQGDLAEAWSEGARDYATVALRFRCRDYTIERASNRVIEGSNTTLIDKVEIWTFVRPRGGGWVVSAIQQTR